MIKILFSTSFFCILLSTVLSGSTKYIELTVKGTSMFPLIRGGEVIRYAPNYYLKNKIGRGDIVIIRFSHRKNPIVKKVRGIPNDLFDIRKIKNTKSCHLVINGHEAKNFMEKKYLFGKKECALFALYIKDYKGVIPSESYLVLGEKTGGTLDSSKFGLISRKTIIGKVLKSL